MTEPITVRCTTAASLADAWRCFTEPACITQWNFASDDWACPAAETDLQPGGAFSYQMAARDGSFAFDYAGTWEVVEPHRRLVQRLGDKLGDSRMVEIRFEAGPNGTEVTETFDPDAEAPRDLQQQGWQAILDRFAAVAGTCR